MKASEIFLNYAAPIREGLQNCSSVEYLRQAYMIPELVWNCVVLDKNRKPGQLPSKLLDDVEQNFPKHLRHRGLQVMNFWVQRKEQEFSQYQWPIVTEIYENLKKEVIVRVSIHGDEKLESELPNEWKNKSSGKVVQLPKQQISPLITELVAFKKEKEAAEKAKLVEFQDSLKSESQNQPIDELQKMNLSEETVRKVEQQLESAAKEKVADIQGQYYETYD